MAVNISRSLSGGGDYKLLGYSYTNIHLSSRDMSFWTAPIHTVLRYWFSIHLGENCLCLTVPGCLPDVEEPENNTACLLFSNRKCSFCRDSFESTNYYQNNPLVSIKETRNDTAFTWQDTKYSKEGKSSSISLNKDMLFSKMSQLNWRIFLICCLNISGLAHNLNWGQGEVSST